MSQGLSDLANGPASLDLAHGPGNQPSKYAIGIKRNGAERSVPLLVLDDCDVRNKDDEEVIMLLVGNLYPCRRTFACVLDLKAMMPMP